MSEISTSHHTVTLTRAYDASPARVFAAWREAPALARWYVPGDGTWASRIVEHDFRIGGRKYLARRSFARRYGSYPNWQK